MGGLPGNALLPSAFLVCAGCSHFTINSHAPSDCPWRFLRSKTTATSSPLVISGDLRAGKRPKPGSPKRGGLGYSLPLTPRYLSVTKKTQKNKKTQHCQHRLPTVVRLIQRVAGTAQSHRQAQRPGKGTVSLCMSPSVGRGEKKKEKKSDPLPLPHAPQHGLFRALRG